ncbi:hypothetical protein AOLI_G00274720 [Acnodon oligacanthus]
MRSLCTLWPTTRKKPFTILYPALGILLLIDLTALSKSWSERLLYVDLLDSPCSHIRQKTVDWLTPIRFAMQDSEPTFSYLERKHNTTGCSKFSIKEDLQKDLKVYDESGTGIEDDVFEDLLKDPNGVILKLVAEDEMHESLNSSADLSSCDSDDRVILPPNERQREDCEAERVIENILLKKPGGDRVIKEYT